MDFLPLLGRRGWRAARQVVQRVRRQPGAQLQFAALFGSRARGDARPDSDIDLLLIFDRLAPDREPEASRAEGIAHQVARESRVPVTVWAVSRDDLRAGRRTPVLVDALEDAIPLWPPGARLPRVRFTLEDALFCAACLLDRVDEGSAEVGVLRRRGRFAEAWERTRDDLVRLCTAALLLEGRTRPRRDAAIRALWRLRPDLSLEPALRWAEASYRSAPALPSPEMASRAVARLRRHVLLGMHDLREARDLPPFGSTAAASRGHVLRTSP